MQTIINAVVIVVAAGAIGFSVGAYRGSRDLQDLVTFQQSQVSELQKVKSLKPADVCPGWWFGDTKKNLVQIRNRICGK